MERWLDYRAVDNSEHDEVTDQISADPDKHEEDKEPSI